MKSLKSETWTTSLFSSLKLRFFSKLFSINVSILYKNRETRFPFHQLIFTTKYSFLSISIRLHLYLSLYHVCCIVTVHGLSRTLDCLKITLTLNGIELLMASFLFVDFELLSHVHVLHLFYLYSSRNLLQLLQKIFWR